ncbi:protein kinase [Streptomyces vinaceus]|uniref:serine/threonine-protein kinase n=1 Tax=Streptomyces vinaceus TaxID=1960 RepID=UPI0035D95B08
MSTWSVPGYYEIRELGSGGSGRVMSAVDLATRCPVAIKYLHDRLARDPRFLAEFRAEARLLQQLDCPHVARFHRYVESEAGAAIVVELIDGLTLRTLLCERGATTPQIALAVLKGSLLGLSAAHRAGVVHRDYKPENVLVDREGVSTLIDFGIAARTGATPAAAGTPVYMAPEQWQGGSASPSTDVYAATLTFFECVTGARPFSGDNLAELARQHLSADVGIDAAPEPVRPLILRGMAKHPRDRPATADQFLAELERVATAHYGRDWEDRARRALAALAGALLARMGGPAAGIPDTTTALATTDLGGAGGSAPASAVAGSRGRAGAPRTRKGPGRTAVIAAAATLLGLTVLGAALLTGNASDRSSAPPGPVRLGSPGAGAGAHTPTAGASASPPSPGSEAPAATASPERPASPSGPPAPPVPTAGDEHPPPRSPSSSASPPPQATRTPRTPVAVTSVGITSLGRSAAVRGADAEVTVTTTDTEPVTVTLTWFGSTSEGVPQVRDGNPETYRLGGRTTYTLAHRHAYTSCDGYWGLQVTSTPASGTGPAYRNIESALCRPGEGPR